MTDLIKYREFFQSQKCKTRTFVNSDDVEKWWVLEVYTKLSSTFFTFDYKSEKLN